MINKFKIGDKVKLKHFNSKEEYNNARIPRGCSLPYIVYLVYYNACRNQQLSIIEIWGDYACTLDGKFNGIGTWYFYQLEKVYTLLNKFKVLRKLMK